MKFAQLILLDCVLIFQIKYNVFEESDREIFWEKLFKMFILKFLVNKLFGLVG